MRLSPEGSRLAVMNAKGGVTVFDVLHNAKSSFGSTRGQYSLRGYSLAFSPDETLLGIVLDKIPGGLQRAEIRRLDSSRPVNGFPGRLDIDGLAFIPRSRCVVASGGTRPRIWRLDPPRSPDVLAGHAAEAWAAAFSFDGKVLATGSDDTHERQTIKLWDPVSGNMLAGWAGHTATVASLAFSPDGRTLASTSLDSGKPGHPNVLIWDVPSRKRVASPAGHAGSVRAVAYSADARLLATGGDDGSLRLWDTTDYSPRAVLANHTLRLTSVAFSPDSARVASASCDTTVKIWDVATAKPAATLRSSANVNAVAFSPDGSLIATATETGEVTLWNVETGAVMLTIHAAADLLRCLKFTPDGRYVTASGKDKVIRLWEITTGQEVLTLKDHEVAGQRPGLFARRQGPGFVQPRRSCQAVASRTHRHRAATVTGCRFVNIGIVKHDRPSMPGQSAVVECQSAGAFPPVLQRFG